MSQPEVQLEIKNSPHQVDSNVHNTSLMDLDVQSERCLSSETLDQSTDSSEDDLHRDSKLTITEFKAIGSWGNFGVDDKAWCDKNRPFVETKPYEDLDLSEEEKSGYLTDRIIACCSSYLDKCPMTGKYVLCKCVLHNKGLTDIFMLNYHRFLQYVDLSRNKIEDLSALGSLSCLMYLDVSYNRIRELLNFSPPHNLTFVNFSHNLIEEMTDLSLFWSIKRLDVSHNFISSINGLQNLKYLETLNLSYNRIQVIENLDFLNLQNLNLEHNNIHSFTCGPHTGFKTMPYLTHVRLGHNELSSLRLFEGAVFVQSIDIHDNNILNLLEVSYLENLGLLISVNFYKNPIRNWENYESICVETIKKLQYLDGHPVSASQKVSVNSEFNPDIKQQAANEHAYLLSLSHLSKLPNLGLAVIPTSLPTPPLIVFVGPLGAGQEQLMACFEQKFPRHVIKLVCHTDRQRQEESDKNFYFVTKKEFNNLLQRGEFLMTYSVLDLNYGLSQEEFGRCAKEKEKVLFLQADITAALTLRIRGFKPILILIIPLSINLHRRWLTENYGTTVFSTRYPEAAIKISRRENVPEIIISKSSLSDESTTVNRPLKYIEEPIAYDTENEEYNISPSWENVRKKEDVFVEACNFFLHFISEEYSDYTLLTRYLQFISEPTNADLEERFLQTTYNSRIYDYFEEKEEYEVKEEMELFSESSSEDFTKNVPPALVDDFYNKILNSRDTYLDFHRKNPGVFYDVIYTDDLKEAEKKLESITKSIVKMYPQYFETENAANYLSQKIIKQRKEIFEDDMERATVKSSICFKKL